MDTMERYKIHGSIEDVIDILDSAPIHRASAGCMCMCRNVISTEGYSLSAAQDCTHKKHYHHHWQK